MFDFFKKTIFFLIISLSIMNMQCEDNDDVIDAECDFVATVNKALYDNLETASFQITSAEIINDCLEIKIGASGCDGNSWEFNLVDSGAVAESLPEQRFLKLQLINEELCDAYFEKTTSFDLTPLQINNGVNEVILHIEGLESALNYKY